MNRRQAVSKHYKMYKSDKRWVIAGIVSGSLMLAGGVTAQAADQSPTTAPTTHVMLEDETPATTKPTIGATVVTAETVDSEPALAEEDHVEVPAAATDIATTKPSEGASEVESVPTETGDETSLATAEPDAVADTETPATTKPTVGAAIIPTEPATAPTTPSTTTSSTTTAVVPTTKPAVIPVAPVMPVTVDPVTVTRPTTAVQPILPPDLVGVTPEMTVASLVQTELMKPATNKLTLTKETASIDLWMPNRRLQQVVLAALQELPGTGKTWSSVADITQEDMALLKKLIAVGKVNSYIDGKTPYSLVGLEYAINLETLMLGGSLNHNPGAYHGDIEDITPLANLQQLQVLDLQYNRIKDISPLAGLQNLQQVHLASNYIRDFSPLKGKLNLADGTTFSYTSQFILLYPLMVSDRDRQGHLQVACTLITGEVVQLAAASVVGEPLHFGLSASGPTYHAYFQGGQAQSDGQGGLYYTNLLDQKPGGTEIPDKPYITVEPLAENYFLTGKYQTIFNVVQPYVLSQDAASVTVHYVDEDGQPLKPAQTLKPGLVGETYTTEPLSIPGMVLQGTPENATGVYGTTPIEVLYVYADEEADAEGPQKPNPGPSQPGTGGGTTTPGTVDPESPATEGNGNGTQPGGQHPGTGGATVTGEGDEGDTVLPGLPGGSAGATVTGTGTGSHGNGQVSPLATITTGSYAHHSAETTPTDSEDTGDQGLSASVGATTLPQTDDERGSLAWGVALLVGLLSLTNFKRRSRDKENE